MSTPLPAGVEIYPMPSFPRLTVSDIAASTSWYCETVGFTNIFTMPGPAGLPSLVHLRWIKYADLLLFPDRGGALKDAPKGLGVALNFMAEDVGVIAERVRRHGGQIAEGPVDRPWNVTELVILDPDGYRLVFNSRRRDGELRSFDDIVASASQGASR